jgi:hypothetical protein
MSQIRNTACGLNLSWCLFCRRTFRRRVARVSWTPYSPASFSPILSARWHKRYFISSHFSVSFLHKLFKKDFDFFVCKEMFSYDGFAEGFFFRILIFVQVEYLWSYFALRSSSLEYFFKVTTFYNPGILTENLLACTLSSRIEAFCLIPPL